MGANTKPDDADISQIKQRSNKLRDIYKQYRLLQELAPIFLKQEESNKLGKNYTGGTLTFAERKERIQTIRNDISNNIYYFSGLSFKLKKVLQSDMSQKSLITLDVYKTLMSRQKMDDLAKTFGFTLTDADFKKPDGSTITDYQEISEMFLRTKIMPAMFTHPWKQKEIGAMVLSTIVAACIIATLAVPGVSSLEINIGAALLTASVVVFACTITLHQLGQSLTSKLGTENCSAVDKEIRDHRIQAEDDLKQAQEAKAKREAEIQKNNSTAKPSIILGLNTERNRSSTETAINASVAAIKKGFNSFFSKF